jgi:hypothetical protein
MLVGSKQEPKLENVKLERSYLMSILIDDDASAPQIRAVNDHVMPSTLDTVGFEKSTVSE